MLFFVKTSQALQSVIFSIADREACEDSGCAHMCVLTHLTDVEGVGHRCMCDTGYQLGEDLKSCTRKWMWRCSGGEGERLGEVYFAGQKWVTVDIFTIPHESISNRSLQSYRKSTKNENLLKSFSIWNVLLQASL